MDKASDFESEDWGFESLCGLSFLHLVYDIYNENNGRDGIRTHARRPYWISSPTA